MCASVFAVSAEELPARVFLTYFTRKSAFKRFGFHPEGTIGLWQAAAEAFGKHGGELWLSAPVTQLHVENGAVTGVTVERDGTRHRISAPVVVSDIGPFATVGLAGGDEQTETGLLLTDLREQIPGFAARARILSTTITRDEWPPQRAVAGFDLPHTTPVDGLWNVGDAVKVYANGGTTACAETAQLVVEEITAAFPPPPAPAG